MAKHAKNRIQRMGKTLGKLARQNALASYAVRREKMVLPPTIPRNPTVLPMRQRKSGAHRQSIRARRQAIDEKLMSLPE